MRLLVDINVVLDVLLDRRPHAGSAARIWAATERGIIDTLLPAHGYTTIFYIAARERDAAFARRVVNDLLGVFRVARVDDTVLKRALVLAWADFEDAVCAAAAEAEDCDALVTRDPEGFPGSPVPVVDPATAVMLIERDGGPDRVAEATSELSKPARRARPGGRRARS